MKSVLADVCPSVLTGANVNRTTANNDHTVLSLACAGGHLAVVELLLAHGADPTHRLKVCPSADSFSPKSKDTKLNFLLLYSLQLTQFVIIQMAVSASRCSVHVYIVGVSAGLLIIMSIKAALQLQSALCGRGKNFKVLFCFVLFFNTSLSL